MAELTDRRRKRALEAALEGELTHHLGYPPHDPSGRGSGNSRNGRTAKRLESESGSLDLEVPRGATAVSSLRS